MEIICPGCGEKRLCASHSLLHVDIVAEHFGGLNALTDRVGSCRFACRTLDHHVDRMTSDTQCRRGTLRYKHERECVKRPGPLDQVRVLEAERMLFLDKLVAYDNVIAAGAAQPGGVPRVQDFALRQPEKTLPGFGHAVAVDTWDVIFADDAAQINPFAVMAPADKRKASADAVAARHPHCSPCRRTSRARGYPNVGIHRAGHVLIKY